MKMFLKNSDLYKISDGLIIYCHEQNKLYTYTNNDLVQLDTPIKLGKFFVNTNGQILIFNDNIKDSFCIGNINGGWERFQLSDKIIESIIMTDEAMVYLVLSKDNTYSYKKIDFGGDDHITNDWAPYVGGKATLSFENNLILVKQIINQELKITEQDKKVCNIYFDYILENDDYKITKINITNSDFQEISLTSKEYEKLKEGVCLSEIKDIKFVNQAITKATPNINKFIENDIGLFNDMPVETVNENSQKLY